jgi:hypothetical protein
MLPDPCIVRVAKAHAGTPEKLILGRGTAIGLAKLEQRAVGEAPVAISLCRGN